MAVRINTSNTFKTEVKFIELDADGKPDPQAFVGEFKRLDRDGCIALRSVDDTTITKQVLVGWDLVDENGKAMEFGETNLGIVLKKPGLAGAIALTYLDAVAVTREKN